MERHSRARTRDFAIAAAAVAALTAASFAQPGEARAENYPSQRLDWTIAFGPGGGNDMMARTMIEIIEKYDLYSADITATNRAGGSGAVGWGYVHANAGDPYQISTTSGSFINTPLQADTPWQPTDFTPVALLASDDTLLVVPGDSPIQSFEEFVEAAKENPPAVGGIGSVNVDFIIATVIAEQAGYEFDYVAFNAQGQLTTALLSGALDAMIVNPGQAMGLIESGDVRPLAFSGRAVPEALGDIPTLGDLGIQNEVAMPRGLILAPDVSEEVQQFWIGVVQKIVETPEWAQYMEANVLTENILYGEDFREWLGGTQQTFAEILRAHGAIQ
jgi:putative tricarboxylic transport membrane protein